MSEPTASREELERLMAEMEQLKTELSGYAEQESYSRSVLNEYTLAKEGLEALQNASDGQESLVPLGGRVMIRASIKPEEKVIVGLGRGVSVEKDKADALAWVEERLAELEKGHDQIVARMREKDSRMMELNQTAQAMYMELQEQLGPQQG